MATGIGFSVHIYDPVILGRMFRFTIHPVSGYGHSINAIGGFDTAEISFPAVVTDIEDWYENGILRDVAVFDEAGVVVFEGFVNTVSLKYSGRTIDIGPLTDIGNRVAVVYTPVYTGSTTQPPVSGGQTKTAFADNAASQARFGIVYRVVDGGECTDADALSIRDSYLAEMAFPQKNETFSAESGEISVTLKISGYSTFLSNTPYENANTTQYQYGSYVNALIVADPNSYFSTDLTKVQANTATLSIYNDGTRNCFDIIKSICSLGDASDNRWTFGIYENRIAYYAVVPSVAEYNYKLSEGVRSLARDPGVAEFRPWAIRPAKWLKYVDFPIREKFLSTSIRSDPQSVFIESVNFRAPFGLTINGGRVSSINQKLARLGLGSR